MTHKRSKLVKCGKCAGSGWMCQQCDYTGYMTLVAYYFWGIEIGWEVF